MSDYSEVQLGFRILQNILSDTHRSTRLINALDACAPGLALEAINLFISNSQAISLDTYTVSVSEHAAEESVHGRLSMWRAFGTSPGRVAIVFRVPWYTGATIALNVMMSPVAYLTAQQVSEVFDNVIENIINQREFLESVDRELIRNTFFNMFFAAVTCLKHEGFREELEWRGVYCPRVRQSPLMQRKIKTINGIPQPIYELPLDATVSPEISAIDFTKVFDRLIIGPSPYPMVMCEAFADALLEAGISDAKTRVWPSEIPIRSGG